MTTTTTAPTQATFDQAIAAALIEAGSTRNFKVIHAASRRGFEAATVALAAALKLAVGLNDTGILSALNAAHVPKALAELNAAERRKGMSQTAPPGTHISDHMAVTGALQEADAEFVKLARRHYIGDATALERVRRSREFDTAMSERDQRRDEPVTSGATASWAI